MSVIGSNILAGASGQGGDYTIARSLRFRSSASASLTRTPASAGNRQVFTWSAWVKRGTISNAVDDDVFFSAGNTNTDRSSFYFRQDDAIQILNRISNATSCSLVTTQVFRDPSAWYHIVIAVDTTQATSSNRVKLYINGSQVTSFSTATYPAQNANFQINNNVVNAFARSQGGTITGYYGGYITEAYVIDGQALTPSSFGENNASTGVWQPKKYAGTYGTTGFYLPFSNNSTTTTLGNDFSGNGNNWTTNNISLTAGSTYDSMTDVPTLTSATAANFAVLNPLYNYPAPQLSNGNLTTSNNGTLVTGALSTIGVTSGKWYFEATNTTSVNQSTSIGIVDSTFNFNAGAAYIIDGTTYRITGNPTFATYTNGDTIGVAFDADAGTISFYKNGTLQGTGNYSYLTNGTPVFPYVYIRDSATGSWNANFGQRPFAYTPPTGFVALNTFNLPTPTIGATASTQANKYFDVSLYTGNGSSQSITNSGSFQPDWVWVKERSSTSSHRLVDAVRGVSNILVSNSTTEESSEPTAVTAFNSNGFSVGNNLTTNENSQTYVGWQWKANGSGSTNTAGSITSTVSANTSAGFSVVTYTGNAVNGATVGHGLGVAPKIVIVKSRSLGEAWPVNIGNITGVTNDTLWLNQTSAKSAQSTRWQGNPSSTVFSLGAGASSDEVNKSGATYVAYCFSEVAGYSKFGSYTGNGSSDGTFVYTGFRPAFVLIKVTSTADDWSVWDSKRGIINGANYYLNPNLSSAEITTYQTINLLSNGFKLTNTDTKFNGNGQNYIYMAFAENPFKYSLAR